MKKNTKFIDKEEKELIESIEDANLQSLKGDQKMKLQKLLSEAKENTTKKKRLISFRISEADLRKLKARALKAGVNYQTLIGMAIKKFVK